MAMNTPFSPFSQNPPTPDLNIILMCKDCRIIPPPIVESFSTGDLVCENCGLVLGDRIIDTRSEWRTFADDDGDDPSRVGAAANPLLNGPQLDTVISKRDGGSRTAMMLARAHGRATAHKGERDLVQVYKEISAMAEAIGLPKNISDQAKQLYKRIKDGNLLKTSKENATVVTATCIFIACRNAHVPRTFKEICALTKVPKKAMGKCFKLLAKELEAPDTTSSTGSPCELLPRFCNHLDLPIRVRRLAETVADRAADIAGIAGKSPISVAAAAIYMSANLLGHKTSAKTIANIAGVSDVTIRGTFKFMHKHRDDIIASAKQNFPDWDLCAPPAS